jgi:hypothetical protein
MRKTVYLYYTTASLGVCNGMKMRGGERDKRNEEVELCPLPAPAIELSIDQSRAAIGVIPNLDVDVN